MRRPLPALVCATHNRGKLGELRALISSTSLASQIIDAAALDIDAPSEPEPTYEGNARRKALHALRAAGLPSLGDDGGLEIAALHGQPGLRTARFTEEEGGPEAAMRALHTRLQDRQASPPFRATLHCALALALDEDTVLVASGRVEGQVAWPPAETGPGIFRVFRSLQPPVASPQGRDVSAALALAHETSTVFDPSAAILLHRLRAFSRLLEVVRNHDEGPA